MHFLSLLYRGIILQRFPVMKLGKGKTLVYQRNSLSRLSQKRTADASISSITITSLPKTAEASIISASKAIKTVEAAGVRLRIDPPGKNSCWSRHHKLLSIADIASRSAPCLARACQPKIEHHG